MLRRSKYLAMQARNAYTAPMLSLRALRRHFFLLLVATLVLKGIPLAQALPKVPDLATTTACASADCGHGGHSHDGHHTAHGSEWACQIACDLGAAPALLTALEVSAETTHPPYIARWTTLRPGEPAPPDHPPPIH